MKKHTRRARLAALRCGEVASFDRATLDVQFRLGTNGEVEGAKVLDQEFRKGAAKKK